ncbi:hypothetical protein PC115_g8393 [Phytophthora cactorum]|uniref:Secreted protein n=1 Tax=Phytophthora cactorum TaxID=29920 RepID=A0A8T1CNQ9_9STRA|nr:hypothetical protein PC115_g8393 [Phytophthora cactorum]
MFSISAPKSTRLLKSNRSDLFVILLFALSSSSDSTNSASLQPSAQCGQVQVTTELSSLHCWHSAWTTSSVLRQLCQFWATPWTFCSSIATG